MTRAGIKPERWDGMDPWTTLGLAITLQAFQDARTGGKWARAIMSGDEKQIRRARRRMVACRAWSAAEFFLHSPIWHHFAGMFGYSGIPDALERDVRDILEVGFMFEREGRAIS